MSLDCSGVNENVHAEPVDFKQTETLKQSPDKQEQNDTKPSHLTTIQRTQGPVSLPYTSALSPIYTQRP